jgi:diguanylate cyclase (GGDEF)-like protein
MPTVTRTGTVLRDAGMRRPTLSLRRRLLVGFAAIALPLLVGWAATSLLFRHTLSEFRGVARETVGEVRGIQALTEDVATAEHAFRELAARPPSRPRTLAYERLARRVDNRLAVLAVDTTAEEELMERARARWILARAAARRALRARDAGRPCDAAAVFTRFDAADSTFDRLGQLSFQELDGEVRAAQRLERFQAPLIGVLLALSALVALVVGRWLAGSIMRPVARLKRAASSMRLDDLHRPIPIERADELGHVTDAFNEMAVRLATSRDEIHHQAFHDALTDLPNRALLLDRIEHARARAARSQMPLCVLVLDLDDFKSINDTLGHAAGDELLKTVGERLCAAVRKQDTPARLGGDEFAVLLEDLQEPAEAIWVAGRIVSALSLPFETASGERQTTVSVGLAISIGGAETADELLRNADLAMYRAKAEGKNRVETFRPELHTAAVERQRIESDLRSALANDELFLQYQPLVELVSGSIYGFEALVRWNHPERGLVRPDAFIPVAEQSGLVVPLGRWVLERACMEAAGWTCADGRPVTISVNLSARQLVDENLLAVVRRALDRSGLEPGRLLLEITESALADDDAVSALDDLKRLGVSLAVDDFGTGYSSLSRLRTLPVDTVKIDKSFIDGIANGDCAFVAAILTLAEDLDLATVAEGVEHYDQTRSLLELGCTKAQGFLFSRPVDSDSIQPMLLEPGMVVGTEGKARVG